MKDMNCAYCAEGALVDKFGIKICELNASKVYLFKEQSHRGRVIVASRHHVSEMIDLNPIERRAFLDEVAQVAAVLRKLFHPDKINYGAYGDTGCHLHFHLVPKYRGDAFEWGGTFAMNPDRTYLQPAEYEELVAQIRAELAMGDGYDLRGGLRKLQDEISQDGKVDYAETSVLLHALESAGTDGDIVLEELMATLRAVRADGVITPAESKAILGLLDRLLV